MTETPKSKPPQKDDTTLNETGNGICGIVMPISTMSEEYDDKHWARVRKILEVAIKKSNFTPQVVWSNPEIDVIQSKILQNIYENEIIICDLSNLNPNVMLETGLRLSTKKPTVLITDDGKKKPPFDISSIEYLSYPKNLEYNNIDNFINDLSTKIISVSKSYKEGKYKSFVDNYKFEVVNPTTIEVSGEKFILSQMKDLTSTVRSLAEKINNSPSELQNKSIAYNFTYKGTAEELRNFIYDLGGENISIELMATNDESSIYCSIIARDLDSRQEKIILNLLRGNKKISRIYFDNL